MTGVSQQQLQLQQEQIDFYQQGQQESKTAFGEQQSLLDQMEAVYSPILAKGPNQKGFSAGEESDLNAEVLEGTSRNYSSAARAVGEETAGSNPLPSGGQTQLKEEVANAAAGEESKEQSQILEADYAQGFKEFEDAGSMLSEASGQLNPANFETAATGAGNSAESTASAINQEQNSWEAPVLGAIGSLGGAVIGVNPGNVFGK